MPNTPFAESKMFADFPICVLQDEMQNGVRVPLLKNSQPFKNIQKSLLKAIDDVSGSEYAFTKYHYHEGVEILLINEGSARIVVENRTLAVKKGDMVIANSFEAHGIYLESENDDFQRTCIVFHPHRIFPYESNECRFFTDLKAMRFENFISAEHSASPALRDCILNILTTCKQEERVRSVPIFEELIRFYSLIIRNGLYRSPSENVSYLQDFMDKVSYYIEAHLTEDISTAALAAYCQYTTEHFCRLFKRCFNKTFKDYLNIYRIQKAKELIDSGEFSTIARLSATCGFNNQNHFGNMFKKHVGVSPSDYINRKKELNAEEA